MSEINNEVTTTEVEDTTATTCSKADRAVAYGILGLAVVGGVHLVKDKMVPFVRGKMQSIKAAKQSDKNKGAESEAEDQTSEKAQKQGK